MKVIEQYVELMEDVDGEAILWKIEAACRNCYKSEGKNEERDREKRDRLISSAIRSGHHSVLEHANITFRVVTNRGVSHEWVRHRIGVAYSQESTRYCNYGHGEVMCIWPHNKFGAKADDHEYTEETVAKMTDEDGDHEIDINNPLDVWLSAMVSAEWHYLQLLRLGWQPQDARDVLPNALKTEMVTTMNIRSLRHFFELRCTAKAHPHIRDLALKLLELLHYNIPVLFDDLVEKFLTGKGAEK